MNMQLLRSSNNFSPNNFVQSERPVLRRFLNREGSRNRVLAFEIEGGLEIGKGSALKTESGSDRESFDLLRIRTTFVGFCNC